jgi:hypothetical protein
MCVLLIVFFLLLFGIDLSCLFFPPANKEVNVVTWV